MLVRFLDVRSAHCTVSLSCNIQALQDVGQCFGTERSCHRVVAQCKRQQSTMHQQTLQLPGASPQQRDDSLHRGAQATHFTSELTAAPHSVFHAMENDLYAYNNGVAVAPNVYFRQWLPERICGASPAENGTERAC